MKKNHKISLIGVMLAASLSFQAKAETRYAAHTAEITRLAQVQQAGQLTINRGDAFTLIAKRYADAHGIPLEAAIKGLKAVNAPAFKNAQLDLNVGAAFIVPLKDEVLKAAGGEALPSVAEAAPVALTATAAAPATPVEMPVTPAVPKAVSTPAVPSVLAEAQKLTAPEAPSTGFSIWGAWLLGVLNLMLFAAFFKSQKTKSNHLSREAVEAKRPENEASTTALNSPVAIAIPEIYTEEAMENILSASHAVEIENDADVSRLDSLERRFSQALGGLSSESLDLSKDVSQTVAPKLEAIEISSTIAPVTDAPVQLSRSTPIFFNHDLKTPMQRWSEIGFNVSAHVAQVAQAKVEAQHAAQVSPEVLAIEIAQAPALDVDVPNFLHNFSHHLPEPTYTSVDYEDLLDPTRLQAWLNLQTPEQVLLFAQDAHDARYEDVAHLMLNDVLLRGNAEQCAAALNLRYFWSYPRGVY